MNNCRSLTQPPPTFLRFAGCTPADLYSASTRSVPGPHSLIALGYAGAVQVPSGIAGLLFAAIQPIANVGLGRTGTPPQTKPMRAAWISTRRPSPEHTRAGFDLPGGVNEIDSHSKAAVIAGYSPVHPILRPAPNGARPCVLTHIEPERCPDCSESILMPVSAIERQVVCMGRPTSVWSIALTKVQRHHAIVECIYVDGTVPLDARREERDARYAAVAAIRLAKHRGDVINMLTGDVMDTRHIADKTATANLPTRIFDYPDEAA